MIKLPGVYSHDGSIGWCYKSLKTDGYVFMQVSNGGFDLVEIVDRPQFLALSMRDAVAELRRPSLDVQIVKPATDVVEILVDLFDKTVLDGDADDDHPLVVYTDDGDLRVDWSLVNHQFIYNWVADVRKDKVFTDADLAGLVVPFDKTPHQVLADKVLRFLKNTLASTT